MGCALSVNFYLCTIKISTKASNFNIFDSCILLKNHDSSRSQGRNHWGKGPNNLREDSSQFAFHFNCLLASCECLIYYCCQENSSVSSKKLKEGWDAHIPDVHASRHRASVKIGVIKFCFPIIADKKIKFSSFPLHLVVISFCNLDFKVKNSRNTANQWAKEFIWRNKILYKIIPHIKIIPQIPMKQI